MPRNGLAGSHGNSVFNLMSLYTVIYCAVFHRLLSQEKVSSLQLPQLHSFSHVHRLKWMGYLWLPTLSSVQSLSCVQLFVTPWTAALQASLSITNSQSLLKLMPIESVMPSNHLILCHPLLLPLVFPSIGVFSNEWALWIRWLKDWSFSFNISPSNEYSGLISFRMDWLDLPVVQGPFESYSELLGAKLSQWAQMGCPLVV